MSQRYRGKLGKPIRISSENEDDLGRQINNNLAELLIDLGRMKNRRDLLTLVDTRENTAEFWQLAFFTLAQRHVPGFRFVYKSGGGRPEKWDLTKRLWLHLFITGYQRRNPKMSVMAACRQISKNEVLNAVCMNCSPATLKRRYHETLADPQFREAAEEFLAADPKFQGFDAMRTAKLSKPK